MKCNNNQWQVAFYFIYVKTGLKTKLLNIYLRLQCEEVQTHTKIKLFIVCEPSFQSSIDEPNGSF